MDEPSHQYLGGRDATADNVETIPFTPLHAPSLKQVSPTGLDQYLQEHKIGRAVSGRMVRQADGVAVIELGEGVLATRALQHTTPQAMEQSTATAVDLSSLTSLLQARWKG